MKLLRTVRLDRSDTFVFSRAAEAGEWAVPGCFMFWGSDAAGLEGKQKAAFRSGFLGLGSFGWATLAEVAEATEEDEARAIAALSAHLIEAHGAPDAAAAAAAATEEIAFSASLCDHPAGTIVALHRAIDPDGEIRERFRTLKPTLEPEGNAFAQGCVLPIGIAADGRQDASGGRADGDDGVRIEEVDFLGLMRDAEQHGKPRP